jgi:UDPglucose 6-dehydrogenase
MVDKQIKICCIGAGYIGGTTMSVMADQCPDVLQVTVTDASASKIEAWKSATSENDLPIYEPGIWEILQRCRGRNLHFSSDTKTAIQEADIVFIAVHAPTKLSGLGEMHATDIVHCEETARLIAQHADTSKIVVEKGTFPVKTAQAIERVLSYNEHGVQHQVLSNPDFFSQGSAVEDLVKPSRVLIGGGGNSKEALQTLVDIYATWVPKEKILTPASTQSSELAKLVANAFLAQRISSINSISQVCEMTGADVTQVSRAIGMDQRIGNQFLQAGLGFGKPRFRKDILSLVYLCQQHGLTECAEYWQHVVAMNECQRQRFSYKIVHTMFRTVTGKKLAMLGYAFKKNTSDVRETPPMYILHDLLQEDAVVHVYDPKVKRSDMLKELDVTCAVNPNNTPHLDRLVVTADDPYQACEDAHALLVLTDWEEFKDYDYQKVYEIMAKPAFVFDGRNLLDHDRLRHIGFEVHGIGRADVDAAPAM